MHMNWTFVHMLKIYVGPPWSSLPFLKIATEEKKNPPSNLLLNPVDFSKIIILEGKRSATVILQI